MKKEKPNGGGVLIRKEQEAFFQERGKMRLRRRQKKTEGKGPSREEGRDQKLRNKRKKTVQATGNQKGKDATKIRIKM